jgi:hypothetical protein
MNDDTLECVRFYDDEESPNLLSKFNLQHSSSGDCEVNYMAESP